MLWNVQVHGARCQRGSAADHPSIVWIEAILPSLGSRSRQGCLLGAELHDWIKTSVSGDGHDGVLHVGAESSMSFTETKNGTHPTTLKAASLWGKGLSVAQIAERMGLTKRGVHNALSRAGIAIVEDGKYRMTNPVYKRQTGKRGD